MRTISMQTRRKTYSKSSSVRDGESAACALFDDLVARSDTRMSNAQKQTLFLSESEGEGKRKSRTQSKKTKDSKVTNGKLLSAIKEKEGSSDYNESSAFMVFKDNLKKKKTKNKGQDIKTSERTTQHLKDVMSSGKRNECTEDSFSDELFVEVELEPVGNVKKTRSKSKKNRLATNVVHAKSVKKMEKHPRKNAGGKNDSNPVQKDRNASKEIARDNQEPLACPFGFGDSSPDLIIEEPKRKQSEEDSVLAGYDSFSTDYDEVEIPTPIVQSEESSKYTYTYVSTYTQGTSTPSQSSTKSVNSPYVPMNMYSHLNSTKCPDKFNINEVDFPISPIDVETTPMKPPGMSAHRIPRMGRNKLVTIKESRIHPTPKCSTMLFAAETTDCHLNFPGSLTHIGILNPSPVCNENDVENCFGSPRVGSSKKQTLCFGEIDDNKKSKSKQVTVVQKDKNEVGEEIKEKSKASNGHNKSAEKSLKERDCNQDSTGSATTSAMKKGVSMLKSLKRKASRCVSISSSAKNKKTRRVSFAELQQDQSDSFNPVSSQPIDNEVYRPVGDFPGKTNKYSEKRTSYSNKGNEMGESIREVSPPPYATLIPDSNMEDDQVFANFRKHCNGMDRDNFEICCVSRHCSRYRQKGKIASKVLETT